MPKINFIQPDGIESEVDAMPHESAMEAAVRSDIDGIVAECGGSCMCATCHVYVDPAFTDLVGGPSEMEQDMLAMTATGQRPESRLACQIIMEQAFDGLVLRVAERQM